jgi:SpoVK/Ycf46/Vps4 family AAA+-type ATPase
MFSGQSGTGKTLTANAIAAKLGKKLLLVNYPNLTDPRNSRSETSRYQSIFREAELSDCVVFFDECESLFAERLAGGSSDTTELLTELERFEGIVFLATNRPYDLDEAVSGVLSMTVI